MAKERKRLKKQLLLKYLILFALVAIVALGNIYRLEKEKYDEENALDTTNQTIATDSQIDNGQASNSTSDSFLKQANLNKTSTEEGKGVATISMSEDFFVHQVNLDTQDPDKNNVYEAWVYKDKLQEYFPLGELYNKDGTYRISYVSEVNRLDFTKVVISEEQENTALGPKPTKVLFEGDYKNIE